MASLCQVCDKEAHSRCGGCTEGLTLEGDVCVTSYCSSACQKSDWPIHKTECKTRNLRKQLYRAADVLQSSFYILARATWDYAEVTAGRGSDGQLRVHIKSEPVHRFVGLPGLGLTGLDEKVVLAQGNAMTDVSKMVTMIQRALKGTVSSYEIVVVEPKLEPLIQWLPPQCKPPGHYLHRLKLPDKSTWALDLSGAVYGNTKSLMPWTAFAARYVESIYRTLPPDHMIWAIDAEQLKVRTHLLGGQPANCWVKNNVLAQVGMELSDNALAASMSVENGYGDLVELTKLPAVKFERAQQSFLNHFTANLAQQIEAFQRNGGVDSKLPALVAGDWP